MRHRSIELGPSQSLVSDEPTLETLIAKSHHEPVLLFNHDPSCGISAAAWEEIGRLEIPINVIDVARYHHVGQLVAARTRVRHQSPQIILVVGGRAVWSASHFSVTAKNVRQALRAHTGSGDDTSDPDSETDVEKRPWWKLW
jgi:bacillithiol system protein YtxJ